MFDIAGILDQINNERKSCETFSCLNEKCLAIFRQSSAQFTQIIEFESQYAFNRCENIRDWRTSANNSSRSKNLFFIQ